MAAGSRFRFIPLVTHLTCNVTCRTLKNFKTIGSFFPSVAMNTLSDNDKGKQLSEELSENIAASAEKNSITEPKEINLQSPSSLLTISYAGKVNVYHVSADKAKTIMGMASRVNGTPSSCMSTLSTPSTPIAPSSGSRKIVALPTTPKFSIQRFLEKRKERLHGRMAPYSPRPKTD